MKRTFTFLLYASALGAFFAFGWVAGLVLAAVATFRLVRRIVRFRRQSSAIATLTAALR